MLELSAVALGLRPPLGVGFPPLCAEDQVLCTGAFHGGAARRPVLQAAEGILKTSRNKCFVALYSFHRSQPGSLLTAFHLRQTAVDECNFARPQKRANLEVHCGAMPLIVWDQIGYLQVTCINIIMLLIHIKNNGNDNNYTIDLNVIMTKKQNTNDSNNGATKQK